MSASDPASAATQAASAAAQSWQGAWQEVRGDPTIQFAPAKFDLPNPPPIPPGAAGRMPPSTVPSRPPPAPSHLGEWLRSILEPIGKALGLAWPVMQWLLIGLGVVIVVYVAWRIVAPWLDRRKQRGAGDVAADADWAPDRAAAQALIDEADALAAQGLYADATHLLLVRSVDQIAGARPDWVLPASTTREISAITGLSDRARSAFALIAQRVERSLFALNPLNREDWLAARAAYADFALAPVARDTEG